jgi:hypothetical protein
VADEHEALARDSRDQRVEVRAVIEEVVVAAGTDPVAVAVAAKVDGDDVCARREALGDFAPAIREIEKAMDEDEGRVARTIPVEQVIRKASRKREPA